MSDIYQRLVLYFQTQERTAEQLLVNQSTVSGWVRGKHAMSAETAFLAQKKTGGLFLAKDLRPSLAEAPPTLNQIMPQISTADQSGKPSVHPSSTTQASA
ncbi:helix-turn-helix domain-containing protein [Pseudomonas sp. WS 5010]|uniref:helix-turn-helix domain-containing protein n=1 Tax=Pseudomonas sp. WS 5010 TaxID=2717489 RepID=UPI0016A95C01|nr:helix-turn-helix domain-containing protein [Pseudomonas sp. WS 5010]NMX88282.1 helix-turn-helix domain-containing protein [Pseudomonas sp. WS 5010]|tara:strand:+ start:172 stop:471 length:300 start_codon:yes stop_codon:yes gene_type:complete